MLDDSNKMVFFNGLTVTYLLSLPSSVKNRIKMALFSRQFFDLIFSSQFTALDKRKIRPSSVENTNVSSVWWVRGRMFPSLSLFSQWGVFLC